MIIEGSQAMTGPKVAIEFRVSEAMHQAAMKKAVEVGLLPKHVDTDTYLKQWDNMKAILQAALDAA